jgi:phage-related holin
MKQMKSIFALTIAFTTVASFICSYFFNLAINNVEQYFAVVTLIFADGFFGVLAGTKREGFKTYKALKVLKTVATWIGILTLLLIVEKGFKGTYWLSETIIVPFIVFQIISILKNAASIGLIQHSILVDILKKIDKHKDG